MTRAQIAIREIIRWTMVLGIWQLAHHNGWVLALAIYLRLSERNVTIGSQLPHDVVRLTVDGKAERVNL